MQRLRAAEHRGQRLDRRADDVVVRVLLGEADARGLAMRAQREARRVLRRELPHQPRPQQPRGAQLRDLHEEIHADPEEERQPRREIVDREAARQRRAHVFEPVGEGEGELLHRGRAGFLHVIAGDRDRVELRHVPGGVLDDVGDDPHRRPGRVDIGVADHELLEDVVLDRARELVLRARPAPRRRRCSRRAPASTAPFIVIDTLILSSGMPSNRIFMSSTESIATPALPTSPTTRGWSLS